MRSFDDEKVSRSGGDLSVEKRQRDETGEAGAIRVSEKVRREASRRATTARERIAMPFVRPAFMTSRARTIAFGIVTMLLTGCPAGFVNLCDNDACESVDGSMGDSGGDTIIPPPNCDLSKDPRDSQSCVADTVGIFVSQTTGLDTNPGTKEAPVQTIAKGISLTGTLKRLYVCAGTYAEDLSLDATHDGVSIYGGWQCGTWDYLASAQPMIGKTNNSAKISGLTQPIFVEDLTVTAADGVNPGDSSVAMFVANVTNVTFERVTLNAGVGQNGAPGMLTNYTYPTQAMLNGSNASGSTPGAATTVTCPGGQMTVGGGGGASGFSGDAGLPALGGGAGGILGQACAGTGTGANGANASAGADATAITTLGALTATGWTPTSGGAGAGGGPGQGGGGGQGSGGGAGGGGGCGGCGGAAATGGGAGGASVALAAFSSTVTVTTSIMSATTCGNGGAGVAGQLAQSLYGFYGNGSAPGCPGGSGGGGGNGGASAGGAGGISVGVLWKAMQPNVDTGTMGQITFAPMGGAKGTGGNSPTNDGVAGVAMAILQSP